jgi:hypothetical protein
VFETDFRPLFFGLFALRSWRNSSTIQRPFLAQRGSIAVSIPVCALRSVAVTFAIVMDSAPFLTVLPARDRVVLTGPKKLAQLLFAPGEDPLDIGPDKESVDQEIEKHGVTNIILHKRPAVPFRESMLMNP